MSSSDIKNPKLKDLDEKLKDIRKIRETEGLAEQNFQILVILLVGM